MKFKVVKKCYINEDIHDEGDIIDVDKELLVFVDGALDMRKHSALVPMEKVKILEGGPLRQEGIDVEINGVKTKDPEYNPVTALDEDQVQAVKDALETLDNEKDEQWTGDGKPQLKLVTAIVGFNVKRSDIDAISPDFTRTQSE